MKRVILSVIAIIALGYTTYANSVMEVNANRITGNIIEVVRYYETGEILESGYIENGMLTGKWLRFDKKGLITAEANYKKGMKHGTWRIYNAEGNLCYEMHYKNNVRIDAKCYLEKPTQVSLR